MAWDCTRNHTRTRPEKFSENANERAHTKTNFKRSRRVFCGGCFASRWFSEVLAFRSSDSQSLNQGYTMCFQQSTMYLLDRRKPLADTSNKPRAPHPPRRYGNNHTLEVLHDGMWGTPLANPLSKNLVEKLPTTSSRCGRNANNVGQDFWPNDDSHRSLPEGFCACLQNLWESLKNFENLWKSLKISENLWKPLKTSARDTSRR